jgi:tetratricopeptide (TPR) repeat protein
MLKLSPPAARARVQLEAAELCEKELGDPEAAASGYLQALTYEPASAEAFHAVQRIFRKLDRPAELLRAVEQRLTQTSDVDEQIALLYEAAELFERKAAPLQADRRLERILQLRPREVRALEGLERLRRAGERWTALAETLSRHVDVADTAELKANLCGNLGELSRQALRDDDGAVRWWKRSLEYLPLHRPALHALAELHQLHGHWLEATRLLAREAELETDPPARAQLEFQAGLLREERLHDLTGATASYHRALVAEATHLPSLRRLRALCQRAGDWPGYEQTLTQEGEHAPEAGGRPGAARGTSRPVPANPPTRSAGTSTRSPTAPTCSTRRCRCATC